MPRFAGFLALLALCRLSSVSLGAPSDDVTFFEKKVRPLLVERCLACHGPQKQQGSLRLDSRAAVLVGGDRGTAAVPGKPEESLLIRALGHDDALKMPPKSKLSATEIATLREWVRLGLPWPDSPMTGGKTPPVGEREFTAEEKAFWAFQPVRPIPVPEGRGGATAIDRFIEAKWNANRKPAQPADRLTLLRRVTLDLTGLPPTRAAVEEFLADTTPMAYERVVERLLASPAYGEKWGRRWLDTVRYADSNGMDENLAYVNAWRYRDWVVRSFNQDRPYDVFVREQIAGDLIPGGSEAERAERVTATGFLVIGPKMLAEDDPVKMRMDIIDEQVDTLGQAVLGLTLGCARCHDHKFDPISTKDYYSLAGIFYSTKTMKNYSVVAHWNERVVDTPEQVQFRADHEHQIKELKVQIAQLGGDSVLAKLIPSFQKRLAELEKNRPRPPEVMAVEDDRGQNLRVHLRGNHLTLGTEAPRGWPRILAGMEKLAVGADRSGRLELAQWVTRPEHPLTARVMVNRIWAGHFGTGLVRSMDNFGRLGDRPTHPELLDWLAAEFVRSGWSIKQMHRLILRSDAYQRQSRDDATDPENRWLTRFNRRRLDAEEVRDGMLAVAGLLDRSMGGTLLTSTPRQYVTGTANRNYEGYRIPRRTLYLPVVRSAVYDVLQTLDFPDPSVPSGQRATTTVPTQALLMLNSALVDQAAEAFARDTLSAADDDRDRLTWAYQAAYGRPATLAEVGRVRAYLTQSIEQAESKLSGEERRLRAWRGFCRVLLASNEFIFVR